MLLCPAADIAARFPGVPGLASVKHLHVVGLIGRTRGSTASLHERQRNRSRTRMHGLVRLTHTSMTPRSGCGMQNASQLREARMQHASETLTNSQTNDR